MTPPAAASQAQPLAPRRPRATPPRPRRISGPSRPPRPAPSREAVRRPAEREQGLATHVLARLEALSSHRLLDRLIRGRLWIGIIAFALIGIVTLQLGLLKLNSGIGRALERQSALERQNAALAIEDSELAAGSRVESQAERLGMRLVGVGVLKFRTSRAASDVPRAEQALSAPATQTEHAVEASPTAAGSAAATEASSATAPPEPSGSGEAAEGATQADPGGEAAPSPAPAAGSGEPAEASAAAPAPASGAGGGTAAPGG